MFVKLSALILALLAVFLSPYWWLSIIFIVGLVLVVGEFYLLLIPALLSDLAYSSLGVDSGFFPWATVVLILTLLITSWSRLFLRLE